MVNNKGMVNDVEADSGQNEIVDIPAGSSSVENDKQYTKKTFPTLTQLREEVKEELGERYWPEISISEEELERETGITRNMYIEFLAEEPDMAANVDKMIIIHAKEDYVGAVEQALEDYRLKMIEENQKYLQESLQSGSFPDGDD